MTAAHDPSLASGTKLLMANNIFDESFQHVPFSDWLDENKSIFRYAKPKSVYLARVQERREAYVARLCKRAEVPFFLPLVWNRRKNDWACLWPGQIAVSLATKKRLSWIETQSVVTQLERCNSSVLEQMRGIGVFNRRAFDGVLSELGPIAGKTVGEIAGPFSEARSKRISKIDDTRVKYTVEHLGRTVQAILPIEALRDRDQFVSLDEIYLGQGRRAAELDARVETLNAELIKYLQRHPDFLFQTSPHKFEEIIASLLVDMGFEIQFTPRGGGDGGKDILAAMKLPIGTLMTIVECKRYAPNSRVSSDIVERFMYTIDRKENASCGLIATTSFFAGEAKAMEEKFKWRLKLRDLESIRKWLSNYGKWTTDEKSGLFVPTQPKLI
ncbi:hypothetical protein RPD_3938 [Rhodopseudomonas palustris BisB5]|uniref:Restriction endonuclease type IV Mrr domain-containing protein n=1 Tax=Rhodopseudomonas palustris (strain BisB5) TaxID=316057 RepID=Q131T0_RHOPS|nr:hypothetical protein RPD_3938 [Rhodopseudomonas palustris BisB5]